MAADTGYKQSSRLDLDGALHRLGGDADLFGEIIRMFIDECPVMIQAMRTAIQAGDAAELQRNAHKFKGSVGYLGARDAVQLGYRLECMGQTGKIDGAAACLGELVILLEELVRGLKERCA